MLPGNVVSRRVRTAREEAIIDELRIGSFEKHLRQRRGNPKQHGVLQRDLLALLVADLRLNKDSLHCDK